MLDSLLPLKEYSSSKFKFSISVQQVLCVIFYTRNPKGLSISTLRRNEKKKKKQNTTPTLCSQDQKISTIDKVCLQSLWSISPKSWIH